MVAYLDGASLEDMAKLMPHVKGVTTNPSLMKKSGVSDYRQFARSAIMIAGDKPVSFEVFSDDLEGMEEQARIISGWGNNVYVKIPVTTTRGESTAWLMKKLSLEGIKINATAVFTFEQIETVARSLMAPAIISIFCGRISDTGRDPVPFITKTLHVKHSLTKVLWASTRELYNIKQARDSGCDIITVGPELLSKMHLIGKDLAQFSLETVVQFHEDAKGLSL